MPRPLGPLFHKAFSSRAGRGSGAGAGTWIAFQRSMTAAFAKPPSNRGTQHAMLGGMRRCHLRTGVAGLLALAALGCSGASEPAPAETDSSTEPACEKRLLVDPTMLIDDMEDGDGLAATTGIRNGGWWVSTDGTAGGEVEPPAEQAPSAEHIVGGRCDSRYAMHVRGSGFTDWGSVISVTFRYTSDVTPFDASAFRGITFYARAGKESTAPIRVQLQDSSTYPLGGVCNPASGAPDECYNGFGMPLATLGTEWQKLTLDFSEIMQREGWGYQADALDTANLYTLEWSIDPDHPFDLWIDDVWFYE